MVFNFSIQFHNILTKECVQKNVASQKKNKYDAVLSLKIRDVEFHN